MSCADISMLRSVRTAPDVGETRALEGSRLDWPNSLCADGPVAAAAVIGTSLSIASPSHGCGWSSRHALKTDKRPAFRQRPEINFDGSGRPRCRHPSKG